MIGFVPDTVFLLKVDDKYVITKGVIRVFMQRSYAELFAKRYEHKKGIVVVEEPLRDVMATVRAMGDATLMMSHCHPRRLTDAEVLVDPEAALH